MKHKLTHNLTLKLLSVLSACVIWLLVLENNDPESRRAYKNIPVTQVNQDTITNANKTYSVVDNTDVVTVYVKARRSVHSRLSSASFTVKADMENYNEDLGSVPLEVSCNIASVTAENMEVVPGSMKINLEDKVEQSFGIVASVSGQTANGYELGRTTILTGDTIKIAGPQSLINIIGKVTVPIELNSSIAADTDGAYAVRIQDKNGAQLTDSQMSQLELKDEDGAVLQDNSVEVKLEIWKVYEDIALNVNVTGEPAAGYEVTGVEISPQTVNLTGDETELEELGGNLTLKDILDIEGVTESQEFSLDLEETLVDFETVRLEEDLSSAVTVQVQVDEIGTRTMEVPVSQLTVENAPNGKRLIFTPTDKLSVNIGGAQEVLDDLSTDDIAMSIDMADCQENGSYTLPVTITLPENCRQNGEVTIVVNVEDEEQEEEGEIATEEE